ncbi:MAG: diguanylate cyclase [Bacteroidota bacterium]
MVYNLLYILISVLIPIGWWTIDYCRKLNIYRQVYELENTFEVELDFVHLSKNILQRIMKETKASAGIIYWFDEVQNKFKLKSFQGIPADQLNQISRNISKKDGLLDQVSNSQKELQIKNIATSPYSVTMGLKELSGLYSSLLALPLNTSNKTIGIIILFKSGSNFKNRERRLLLFFAKRAAIQLDHSRLFQLATDTALENAKLYVNISKLYQKVILDSLTGLYNRHFLMLKLREEIKKAYRFKQPLSLIFMDIDLFKEVNDKLGHSAGDQVLIEFTDLLKKSIRESDLACRFGGEEFVIILPQTNLFNARLLAERLREKTASGIFLINNTKIGITASFGVSSLHDLDSDNSLNFGDEALNNIAENLLAWADDALYRAKKGGRNLVVAFENQ